MLLLAKHWNKIALTPILRSPATKVCPFLLFTYFKIKNLLKHLCFFIFYPFSVFLFFPPKFLTNVKIHLSKKVYSTHTLMSCPSVAFLRSKCDCTGCCGAPQTPASRSRHSFLLGGLVAHGSQQSPLGIPNSFAQGHTHFLREPTSNDLQLWPVPLLQSRTTVKSHSSLKTPIRRLAKSPVATAAVQFLPGPNLPPWLHKDCFHSGLLWNPIDSFTYFLCLYPANMGLLLLYHYNSLIFLFLHKIY